MKFFLTIILLFLLFGTLQAQPTRAQAELNPLDCALFLLAKDRLDDTNSRSITGSLFETGRYDASLYASKLDEDIVGSRFQYLGRLGSKRFSSGDRTTAEIFASAAFEDYLDNGNGWSANDFAPLIQLLIEVGRTADAFQIADGHENQEDKAKVLLQIAESQYIRGEISAVAKTLDRISSVYDSEDYYFLIRVCDLYLKLGDRTKALDELGKLETAANAEVNADSRDRLKVHLIKRYLAAKNEKRAFAIWENILDKGNVSVRLDFSVGLALYGKSSMAETILNKVSQKELSEYQVGLKVVNGYLSLGRTEAALRSAKAISQEADNYDQQSAFIEVADHYIKARNLKSASDILDLAYRKAKTIVYEQEPEDSNSSGIRKTSYLLEIADRYVQIGDLERALAAIAAINSEHPWAKEKFALALGRYALTNAKKMPTKRALALTRQSVAALDPDDEYSSIQLVTISAQVYATLGYKEKAVEILAVLLEKAADSGTEGLALLEAGEVFEKYGLVATDRLQSSLRSILDLH